MAGNVFLTPDIIAREALMVLEANMVMANLIHRDYSEEFVQVGDTITARIPAKFVSKNFTNEIDIQDATEGGLPVRMDRHRDVSFTVTSKQLTLDIKEFSTQLLAPAMRAHAQAIDEDLFNVVSGVTAKVDATANATDLKDIAKMNKMLHQARVPLDNRRLVLNPVHQYNYLTTDNMSKASYSGGIEALRNADLGRIFGFETFMAQNAPDTLAEDGGGTITAGNATGAIETKTLSLTGVVPATATIKKGDGIIVKHQPESGGVLYRVAADATATGGAVTVTVDQKLAFTYANSPAYFVTKTHSLAFHRNAFSLVSRPLAMPAAASGSATYFSHNGLGIRVVFGYDQIKKKSIVSLDLIYGVTVLDKVMAVKLIG